MVAARAFAAGAARGRSLPVAPGSTVLAEPNRFYTINWRDADDGKNDPAARIADILRRLAKFILRSGCPLVWLYARETGPVVGEHFHLAVYVPEERRAALTRQMRSWLAVQTGRRVAPRALKVVPIEERAGGFDGLIRYFLKEGTDAVRQEFEVPEDNPKFARKGGIIWGKRVSVSAACRT